MIRLEHGFLHSLHISFGICESRAHYSQILKIGMQNTELELGCFMQNLLAIAVSHQESIIDCSTFSGNFMSLFKESLL